jgi:hypothetical protein
MNEQVLRDVQRKRLIEDLDRLGGLILRVARGETLLKRERDVLEHDVMRRRKFVKW